jgi:hypothetical protein
MSMRHRRIHFWSGMLLLGILAFSASGAVNTNPKYYSFLTKDQNSLTPATQFSFMDRISLQTVWTGLTGTHEGTALWIRPDGKAHGKNPFTFTVPPGTLSYRTSACCLTFHKKRFFISAKQINHIGTWKVQLFLDNQLLSEYSFVVL